MFHQLHTLLFALLMLPFIHAAPATHSPVVRSRSLKQVTRAEIVQRAAARAADPLRRTNPAPAPSPVISPVVKCGSVNAGVSLNIRIGFNYFKCTPGNNLQSALITKSNAVDVVFTNKCEIKAISDNALLYVKANAGSYAEFLKNPTPADKALICSVGNSGGTLSCSIPDSKGRNIVVSQSLFAWSKEEADPFYVELA